MRTRLSICLLTFCAVAPAQKLTQPADAKPKVAAIFAKYNRTDAPGCTAGVSIDGAMVLSAAYGMADLEHGIALTPTYKNGFASSLGSVRFLRDASGRVNELSIGESRVWDLRFRRR